MRTENYCTEVSTCWIVFLLFCFLSLSIRSLSHINQTKENCAKSCQQSNIFESEMQFHGQYTYILMYGGKIIFTGAIRTTCILDLETKPHYWLTVCAQDQAVVPLYSCVEVKLFYFLYVFHLFLFA